MSTRLLSIAVPGLLLALSACDGGSIGIEETDSGDTDVTVDTDGPVDTDVTDTDDTEDTEPQGDLELGDACDPANDQCGGGTLCCTECCEADKTPVCTTPVEGACALPDLMVNEARLQATLDIQDVPFPANDCAIAEGCVGGDGFRRLIKFATQTPNRGTADLRFGQPDENGEFFEFSECHEHYHFTGYAVYKLLDGNNAVVANGHKQAFCLMDYEPDYENPSQEDAVYNCWFQGIQAGWSDTYDAYLDCQWIDITDVPAGDYQLEVSLNPDRFIPELDYTDNVVRVPVTVRDPVDEPPVTDDCDAGYGEWRNCDWEIDSTFACTPGAQTTLRCQGGCTGDPVMRICEGTDTECRGVDSLASTDDNGWSECPAATFTCPDSGQVTALIAPYNAGSTASCDVRLQ